jgi:hypothetical protein
MFRSVGREQPRFLARNVIGEGIGVRSSSENYLLIFTFDSADTPI